LVGRSFNQPTSGFIIGLLIKHSTEQPIV
jgi:hypothetical protein